MEKNNFIFEHNFDGTKTKLELEKSYEDAWDLGFIIDKFYGFLVSCEFKMPKKELVEAMFENGEYL